MPRDVVKSRRRARAQCLLPGEGWHESTRASLERLMAAGAGERLPVVFDFDNTIVRGDIGEATLAVLARSGKISPATISPSLCPPFQLANGRRVTVESSVDLTAYYEALLAPTAHGPKDPTPLSSGYAWAVQAMANLGLEEVIEATAEAFSWSEPARPGFIEVTPGQTSYPVPVFYPEMVELLSELLRHEFDVWIFSASNVWSVRWLVLEVLNPMLRQRGPGLGLRPDHVIGVSALLTDDEGRLYKDAVLLSEDKAYAQLKPAGLGRFRLSSQLQYPVPTYSGKVAAIWDALGQSPYLAVGDSPGDHPMMAFSRHRLWIARLEKPAYQRAAARLAQATEPHSWLVQPALAGPGGGFVPETKALLGRGKTLRPEIRQSLRILRPWIG